MEKVRGFFSRGRDLCADLEEKVKEVYKLIWQLHCCYSTEDNRKKLYNELYGLLGVEINVETIEWEEEWDEEAKTIGSFEETWITKKANNLFDILLKNLPSLSTYGYDGSKDYIIFPDDFILIWIIVAFAFGED